MKKIVITYPSNIPNEQHQILDVLQDENVLLHIRKPDTSEEVYEEIIKEIPENNRQQLVVHDYFHLVEKYSLGGIHLSTRKRQNNATMQLPSNVTISTSSHSIDELRKLDGEFDYVFLSPIYPSISKQGYEGNLNMEEVRVYLQGKRKTKVIALGGIDDSKIDELRNWGFEGYAQLGSVWNLK